ncbi:MAG: hypothetical protein ACOH2Q_17160 [Rhodococcus sp. (in: high G+C Gram-positive bacteria)]
MTEIAIDPNVRVRNDETFSGFEDVKGDFPKVGDTVRVREPESNVVGAAKVTRISAADSLIYLAVEWDNLAEERLLTPSELLSRLPNFGSEMWVNTAREAPHTGSHYQVEAFTYGTDLGRQTAVR